MEISDAQRLIDRVTPSFRVVRPLLGGSREEVFLIQDEDQLWVVKIINLMGRSSRRGDGERSAQEELERDWKVVNDHYPSLRHPGIVRIHHKKRLPRTAGDDKGAVVVSEYALIYMEYCPWDLHAYVMRADGKGREPAIRWLLGSRLVETLHRVRKETGLLMTDMKPENFLVREDGEKHPEVVMGDLGGLVHQDSMQQADFERNLMYVAPEFGELCARQGEMEKEVFERELEHAQVFSLGLVLFFVLEGRLPYEEKNAAARNRELLKEGKPDWREDHAGLEPLVQVVEKCLKGREERLSSFASVWEELIGKTESTPTYRSLDVIEEEKKCLAEEIKRQYIERMEQMDLEFQRKTEEKTKQLTEKVLHYKMRMEQEAQEYQNKRDECIQLRIIYGELLDEMFRYKHPIQKRALYYIINKYNRYFNFYTTASLIFGFYLSTQIFVIVNQYRDEIKSAANSFSTAIKDVNIRLITGLKRGVASASETIRPTPIPAPEVVTSAPVPPAPVVPSAPVQSDLVDSGKSMIVAVGVQKGKNIVPEMEFVWIPGGCFTMGWPKTGEWWRDDDEGPIKEPVCVKEFWMSKYEVTNEQYRMWKKGHDSKEAFDGLTLNAPDQPVVRVSWTDATAYAGWLSEQRNGTFRLPTEAEWEYACRSGGKPEKYCGGNDLGRLAWYEGNSGRTSHPVGQKAPNGLGLYDMSGNVWEWTCSLYSGYNESRKNYANCAEGSSPRVLRGGSYNGGQPDHRSADRYSDNPFEGRSLVGFRLVHLPPE